MTETRAPASDQVASLLAEIADDFRDRVHRGENPDIEEYAERHPTLADVLRQVLPALQILRGEIGAAHEVSGDSLAGCLGDFRIIREVGRGGMGIVYEAEQISLSRRVALKVLPFAATMDPKHLQRFHNEAKAAASLKHEHIVHVYGVGCERGVHYFAMEFIDGQTLAQLIADFRLPIDDCKRPNPGTGLWPSIENHQSKIENAATAPIAALSTERTRDRDFYRRAAALIADAADALEHAHSVGIVHRDVKPGNLLLDNAGKVYVSDFGFAQFGPDAGLTVSGDLLGTLRYMAPEQALAKHGLADHRVDVYGLGATLYELLTGRPAVGGVDKAEIVRHIAFEEPIAPRKLDKSIPAELETITLKCLAKNPDERYATAVELAADLRRFVEDKPIQAKPPTMIQMGARRLRRHPRVVAAALGVALLAVVGALVSTALIDRQRQAALNSAAAEKSAREQAQRRLAQVERGIEMFAGMLTGINPRSEKQGGDPIYLQLRHKAEKAAADLDGEIVGDPLAVARLQMILGETLVELGSPATAVKVLEKARGTQERQPGAEYADLLATLHQLAGAYLNAGRLPEAIRIYEQVRDANLSKLGADHPKTLATLHNLALAYMAAGRLSEAIPLFEQVRVAQTFELGADDPRALTTLNNLAGAYRAYGRLSEAIRIYEQVRDAEVAKLGADHPDTLTTLNNLAGAYQDAGRLSEAIPLFERVRDALVAKLGADHPDTLTTLNNLALAYMGHRRLREAIPLLERVRGARATKLGADHPATLGTLNNLALAYMDAGRLPEAIPLFEQVRVAETLKLGADHPQTLTTLDSLAFAYMIDGRLPEAIPLFEQVRDARVAKLGADHLDTLTTLRSLAQAFQSAGRLPEAIPVFEQAAAGIAKREFRDPIAEDIIAGTVAAYKTDRQLDRAEAWQRRWLAHAKEKAVSKPSKYALGLAVLGTLLLEQEKWDDAEKTLSECLAIRQQVQPDAWSTFNVMSMLGAALMGQEKHTEAAPLLQKGYEGMKTRADKIPPSFGPQRLGEALDRLVQLCEALNEHEEAAKWRQERKGLKPADAELKQIPTPKP